MPGLLSRQDAPQVAVEGGCHARQAEWHANIAVKRALATSHARRPEELLRWGPVEPWKIDADAQPAILAWVGSYARQTTIAVHGSCFLKLLSGLGDELLRVGLSLPCAILRETWCEARLQAVPKRLPRDFGKV